MPRIMPLVVLLFWIVCSPAMSDERVSLVVDPWAPFGGKHLPRGGLSADIISTVLEQAGYSVEVHIVPWARALDGVKSGEYDLLGSLFFDAELEAHLSFSEPYHKTDIRFLKRRGKTIAFSSVSGLEPYSIAVGDGYLYEKEFDNATDLKKRVVTSVQQGIRMVAGERVDLTLDSVDVLDYTLRVDEPGLAERVEYVPGVLATRRVRFAIRNDFPGKQELLSAFRRTLRQMQADGSLEALRARHSITR